MMKENEKRERKRQIQEERERLDNKVVLATAIALVSAMLMLFIYNWFVSAYAAQTKVLIQVLMWIGVAGVAAFLVLGFVKKDKKYFVVLAYCAVGAFLLREVLKGTVTTWILLLASKIPFLNTVAYATTKARFNFVYIALAIYLVASYIYYGVKMKKLKK
ncbi:MAG: hypothetical protein PUB07_02740 [Clostridia bacterium]|nr:hypothetical protein [Clostridia bacterium]